MASQSKRRTWLVLAGLLAIALGVATPLINRLGREDVSSLLTQVQEAMATEDYERAGPLLDRILVQQPQHPQALLERGKLWALLGQTELALEDWRAVEVQPQDPQSAQLAAQARYLEGLTQLRAQQARLAEQSFHQAWETYAEELQPLDHLLRLVVLQMRRHETRRILRILEQRRPLSLEELVLRVDAGGPIIDAPSAITQLSGFVQADPEDGQSRLALARYYLANEQLQAANELLEVLPDALVQDSQLLGVKALALLRSSSAAAAGEVLQASTNGPPGYWWWLAAGELAAAEQQPALASLCLEQAVAQEPEAGFGHYRWGLVLQAAGQAEAAARELEIAANIDRLHQESSGISRMQGMRPQDLVAAMLRIAELQRQLGRDEETVRWARLALQLEPTNALANQLERSPAGATQEPPALAVSNATTARQQLNRWLADRGSTAADDSGTTPSSPRSTLELVDVAAERGLEFTYFNGQSGFKYLIESMGGGIGILDFDNDGWPDGYFPQGSSFPTAWQGQPLASRPAEGTYLDQLLRNRDGRSFENVTSAARLVEDDYSQGLAIGDVNSDGFVDVVVANVGRNRLFLNQGDGTFVDATQAWGLDAVEMSSSAALADLDHDGHLDLYIVNYVDGFRVCRDTQGNISTCSPQNFLGVPDRLYRNNGQGGWEDVTQSSGVLAENGKGLGVVISDLDDDGWEDIYVANDSTPNFLFQNLGGMRFRELGLSSGAALSDEGQAQAGMGIAAADLNGDQRTDLFVTNYYLETNNLYENQGALSFVDQAGRSGLATPSKNMLGFGTQAEDLDADGWPDLFVANGHIDNFVARREPWKMPPQLFQGTGGGKFSPAGASAGSYFQSAYLGRGVASLDWNRDGRQDLVVVHQDRAAALLENRTTNAYRSLAVRLIGTVSNRDAIGARVTVRGGERVQRRGIHGGDGFYCSNQRQLSFGLGPAVSVVDIDVEWPSGRHSSLEKVAPAGELVIVEPALQEL